VTSEGEVKKVRRGLRRKVYGHGPRRGPGTQLSRSPKEDFNFWTQQIPPIFF